MTIDWSSAPEGTTHWQPENALLMAAWIKVERHSYWFRMPHMANWVRYEGPLSHLGQLVPKPLGDTLTEEQLAQETMDDLVRLIDTADENDKTIAEAIYDAGYRKS